MNQVNCLFFFEDVAHRLVIDTSNPDHLIDYEELRKAVQDNPKLKDVNFFDEQKYVLEVFDKGFEEYVKLSKDCKIPDYSKVRSRLPPKSTLIPKTTDATKSGDSVKRPLSMYKETMLEDEKANKIAKKSPNEPAAADSVDDATAEPTITLDPPDESPEDIPKTSSTTPTTSSFSPKSKNSPPCYSIDSPKAPALTSSSSVSPKSTEVGSNFTPPSRPEPMENERSKEPTKKDSESGDNQKERKGNGVHTMEKSSLSANLLPSSNNARIEALKDQFAVSNLADK